MRNLNSKLLFSILLLTTTLAHAEDKVLLSCSNQNESLKVVANEKGDGQIIHSVIGTPAPLWKLPDTPLTLTSSQTQSFSVSFTGAIISFGGQVIVEGGVIDDPKQVTILADSSKPKIVINTVPIASVAVEGPRTANPFIIMPYLSSLTKALQLPLTSRFQEGDCH